MSRLDEDTRKSILQKSLEEQLSTRQIAKIFQISPSTVTRTLKRWNETSSLQDRKQINRRKPIHDPKLEKNVLKAIKHDRTLSLRQLAKKCGCSVGTVQKIKALNEIKSLEKKKKVPKKSVEQQQKGAKPSPKL